MVSHNGILLWIDSSKPNIVYKQALSISSSKVFDCEFIYMTKLLRLCASFFVSASLEKSWPGIYDRLLVPSADKLLSHIIKYVFLQHKFNLF